MFIDIIGVAKLVSKCNTPIISAVDDKGFPHTEALTLRKREELKVFYFVATSTTTLVDCFRKNPSSSIYFHRKGILRFRAVRLTGTVEILEDEESKKSFWKPSDSNFFPKDIGNPYYCIIKFTPHALEYYQNKKSMYQNLGRVYYPFSSINDSLENVPESYMPLIKDSIKNWVKNFYGL